MVGKETGAVAEVYKPRYYSPKGNCRRRGGQSVVDLVLLGRARGGGVERAWQVVLGEGRSGGVRDQRLCSLLERRGRSLSQGWFLGRKEAEVRRRAECHGGL